jgi:hypothetical protein
MVCGRRQPKIKPYLLKIYVVVQVRIIFTESIYPSFMSINQDEMWGLIITKTVLRKKLRNTQIKLSKSIKKTNFGLSQHPSSSLLQLIIDVCVCINSNFECSPFELFFLSLLSCSQLENKQYN